MDYWNITSKIADIATILALLSGVFLALGSRLKSKGKPISSRLGQILGDYFFIFFKLTILIGGLCIILYFAFILNRWLFYDKYYVVPGATYTYNQPLNDESRIQIPNVTYDDFSNPDTIKFEYAPYQISVIDNIYRKKMWQNEKLIAFYLIAFVINFPILISLVLFSVSILGWSFAPVTLFKEVIHKKIFASK